jgi:hypothetical protein
MVDICALPSRALFRLTGSDRSEWLQGLITNDLDQLKTGGALYAALLSPQGKILFDFLTYDTGESFLIDCEAISLEPLMKRLSMYRMRSDVALNAEPGLGVISSCTPLDTDLSFVEIAASDPRLEKLGYRMVGDPEQMRRTFEAQGHSVDGEEVYRDYLIKLGVPNGGADFVPSKAYPLESNFEELNGVSFTKGCFIGQEVVARMKHKTTLKKRLLPITSEDGDLVAGSDLSAGGSKAGTIISSTGKSGLALIRLEEWHKAIAENIPVSAQGTTININVPEWLDPKEDA